MRHGTSKYLIGAMVGAAIVSLLSAPLLGKKQGLLSKKQREYEAKSASLEEQKRLSTSKDEIIAIQNQQAILDKEQMNLYKTYAQELFTVSNQLWYHAGSAQGLRQSYLDQYGYSVVTPNGNTQIQALPRWYQEYRDALE